MIGGPRKVLEIIRKSRKVSDRIWLSEAVGFSSRPTGSDCGAFTWADELISGGGGAAARLTPLLLILRNLIGRLLDRDNI